MTSRLGLYGGPQRPWAAFVAKTVEEAVTAMNVALSVTHPYALGASMAHPYTLAATLTHPYTLAVSITPEES